MFIFIEKHSTNVTALPTTDTSSFNMLVITKDKALYLALAHPPDFNMAVLLMKIIPLNDSENCSRRDYEPIIRMCPLTFK